MEGKKKGGAMNQTAPRHHGIIHDAACAASFAKTGTDATTHARRCARQRPALRRTET
jgi:hypothetical protein